MGEWAFRRISYLRTPWYGVVWGLLGVTMGVQFLAKNDGVGYLGVGLGFLVVLLGLIGRWKSGHWRRQGRERRGLDDLFT